MCLETAQILCTVLGGPYKPTHRNHPCVLWVAAAKGHLWWTLRHWEALCDEYTARYGRVHASWEKCWIYFQDQYLDLESNNHNVEGFVNCTVFKSESDTHMAYKMALVKKWEEDLSPPDWGVDGRPLLLPEGPQYDKEPLTFYESA